MVQLTGGDASAKMILSILFVGTTLFVIQAGARSTGSSSEESKELQSGEEDCIAELNLERNRIVKQNSKSIGPEDDEDYNKFLECFWKKKGYQKQDGRIDFERLKSTIVEVIREILGLDSLGTSVAAATVDKCRDVKGTTNGQTASKVQNCIVNRLREYE